MFRNLPLHAGPMDDTQHLSASGPACSTSSETPLSLRERLVDACDDDELLFLDPPSLDVAIVGLAQRIGLEPVVVYDRHKLVQAFMAEGMSEEDADEWVSFNVEGAYVGERTPLILFGVEQLTA